MGHDKISKLAYKLWENAGRPSGSGPKFWQEAERQFRNPHHVWLIYDYEFNVPFSHRILIHVFCEGEEQEAREYVSIHRLAIIRFHLYNGTLDKSAYPPYFGIRCA